MIARLHSVGTQVTTINGQSSCIRARVRVAAVSSPEPGVTDILCEVNDNMLAPCNSSLGLITKIFSPGTRVLLQDNGGRELPEGKVRSYNEETKTRRRGGLQRGVVQIRCFAGSGNGSNVKRKVVYSFKYPENGDRQKLVKPKAELFEVPVTAGLYTYILVFSDGSYIRTPLMKEVTVS